MSLPIISMRSGPCCCRVYHPLRAAMVGRRRSIDNAGEMNETIEPDLTMPHADEGTTKNGARDGQRTSEGRARMDLLKTMDSFVRVVRTGSFAGAADKRGV